MARPLRIEYANAWHYVKNQGRQGGKPIFQDRRDLQDFLTLLEETSDRFAIEVHAYCLYPNEFQLLIRTPDANLGRSMRHLCGLFTQRFNRRHKLDGSLFKGRYKTVLLEPLHYPLSVASYLHRQGGDKNERPQASSRQAYLDEQPPAPFLCKAALQAAVAAMPPQHQYECHLQDEGFHQLDEILSAKIMPSLLGSAKFKTQLSPQLAQVSPECTLRETKPCVNTVLQHLSKELNVPVDNLLMPRRGPKANNTERHIAMLLCQQCADMPLKDIAKQFGLGHYASVSNRIAKFKQTLAATPALAGRVQNYRTIIEQQHYQHPISGGKP